MYHIILMILILAVLLPSITHLIRYRAFPSSRRLTVGFGTAGLLLSPTAAGFLCEVLTELFAIGLFILIFSVGIGLMIKALFK